MVVAGVGASSTFRQPLRMAVAVLAARPLVPDTDGVGLSIDAAATACGVSRDTIKRRLAAGAFPNATRTRGPGPKGPWRIPEIDLRASGLLVTQPVDGRRSADEDLRLQLAIAQTRVQELRRQVDLLRSLLDVPRA